uniref:Delta-endotoxin CytB n=1 Tax=Moniliophthora roreri TaxID=221103 RepID=A0A0W0EWI9_MONRR
MSSNKVHDEQETMTRGTLRVEGNSVFDALSKVNADLYPTEVQLSKFAGHYLRVNQDPKWFDWDGFLQAVMDYKGNDLVLIYPDDSTNLVRREGGQLIKGSSDKPSHNSGAVLSRDVPRPVSDIVDYIVYFITQVVGVSIDPNAIYGIVDNAFTNLKWASESGFADFSSSSEGTNTSWEYRITFSSPHPNKSDTFLSFVSTIYLEADIRTESDWWGLVNSTVAHYHCDILGLKFEVTKGFKDPY